MTYLNKRVLFNDGEGLAVVDLNNLQSFAAAQLQDFLLGPQAQVSQRCAGAIVSGLAASACFAVGHGGMLVNYSDDDPLTITNEGGIITQWGGGAAWPPNGDAPRLLTYALSADELRSARSRAGLTTGQGRWDILCVKLDELATDLQTRDFKDEVTGLIASITPLKQMAVRLQTQWVTGTPAVAASASEPATPAGYAKLCAVRTDYEQVWPYTVDQLRDYRLPLGYHTSWIHPHMMTPSGGWSWNSGAWVAGAYTDLLYLPFTGPPTARLTSLSIAGMLSSLEHFFGTVTLGRLQRTLSGVLSFTPLKSLAPGSLYGVALSQVDYDFADLGSLPIWGGGANYAGVDGNTGVIDCTSQLAVEIKAGAASDFITCARFGYVGG
jgi:hypothetical protein